MNNSSNNRACQNISRGTLIPTRIESPSRLGQEETTHQERQEHARLTSKSLALGATGKNRGQGDRDSERRAIETIEGGEGKKNRSSATSMVTFARRDQVEAGIGDVGEGEVDHGSRVAAARQRCLPQARHRRHQVFPSFRYLPLPSWRR